MEVACSETSLLSQEVQKQLGDSAAMRCSLYNGYDLTNAEGISKLKKMVSQCRPVHMWISCDCGPFSPLQRLNQRTPEQCRQLEEKRAYARKEYRGAIDVAMFAAGLGTQIHWELSERCEAWKLPEICQFLETLALQTVVCNGCCVGLKAHDTGELMCKGWKIASKNPCVLRHLHLPCQKNHKKTVCESGRPQSTAYYTPVFVKKVVEALRGQECWSLVASELSSDPQVPCKEVALPAVSSEPSEQVKVLEPREKDRILRMIQHIHSVSGHGSMDTLVKSLQKRGVPEHVLQLARNHQCPICAERKRNAPHRTASLEVIPKRWQVIQSDLGSWTHPITKDKIKFIIFVDEGCRFRVGRILFENSRNMATWPLVQKCFEELWLPYFGQPDTIRVDPEGVWRGNEGDAYCESRGIQLTPIPAEAHWQVGIVENAIRGLKQVMSSLAEEFKDMSNTECFSRALWACNSRDNHYGYSPIQHAMGRVPDEWGRLFDSEVQGHPIHPHLMVDAGFAENIHAMATAEQSFSKFQAAERISRAMAAGQRQMKSFVPGDLVFYWRKQVPAKEGDKSGFSWTGQFVGPARVLAVETRQDPDGSLRPGSVVWIHKSGRLLRAAPEQLRAASQREVAIESLKGPVQIPWTITSLASHPSRKTYIDISKDIPTNMDFQEACNNPTISDEGHPTGRIRYTGKKKPIEPDRDEEMKPVDQDKDVEMLSDDPALVAINCPPVCEQMPSATQVPCVEIHVDLPTSKRGLQKFMEFPEIWMVQQLRRQGVEVRERTLTDDELLQFRGAKDKEVKNFVKAHCFKLIPPDSPLAQQSAVGMRWVLTWKSLQDGTDQKKAKARAVILGYQDESYELWGFLLAQSPSFSGQPTVW
eukprot:s167_g36.t1